MLASPEQARIITEMENDGVAHVALISRNKDVYKRQLLTRHLVSLFDSTEFNPKGAQLIFTSHSTNLLDLD